MSVYLTRRERFNAGHRMFNPNLTDEENYTIYGKCANPNWHGHNYNLFVTIKGDMNEELGYVVNLSTLSQIIKDKVIDKIDHKNINIEVDFMKGRVASTENLCIAIWNELEPSIKALGVELYIVKIEETENNFVEYRG